MAQATGLVGELKELASLHSDGALTDDEYKEAKAAVIAESGNLLMMPGRSAGPEWVGYAQALTESGVVAMAAAEARNADALFDAGGQVYQACRACHEQYLVPLQEARNAGEGNSQ